MLAMKIDLLLKKFENYSQDKAQMQTLQALETRMTCELYGNIGHSGDNCLETQEEALYLNGNNNGFRPQGGHEWNNHVHFIKEKTEIQISVLTSLH